MDSTRRKEIPNKNYVLVVDYNGEPDIFQISYDTSWTDVAVMLQVKYECDELPAFYYIDDEDDAVRLTSQEEFEVALQMSRKNDDVLHLKVKSAAQSQPVTFYQARSSSVSSCAETSRSPIGAGLSWASTAVKNAVHGIGQGLMSMTSTENSLSMDDMIFKPTDEEQLPRPSEPVVGGQPNDDDRSHDSLSHDPPVTSTATILREPVYVSDEIEVPTSVEDEVSVKMPYSASSSSAKSDKEEEDAITQTDPNRDVLHTIKQEVQLIVNKEISALREEIHTHLLPQIRPAEPQTTESSDDSTSQQQQQRSPKVIKREIKQLRKEMNEAKLHKRQKKQKYMDKTSGDDISSSHDSTEMRQVRKYAASFICENLLDGSCVGTGQSFTKYWVLKNDGTRPWDHKIKLELLKESPSSDGSSVDPSIDEEKPQGLNPFNRKWGPDQQKVSLPTVNSRETTVIAVRHIAPNHECSYTSSWRLHRKGQPFGPRIWCNVSVVNHQQIPAAASEPYSTLLTTDDEGSFIKEGYERIQPRHLSSHSDILNQPSLHDDDISNMLSFEMTDIGKNFPQQLPPTDNASYTEVQSPSLKSGGQDAEEPQTSQKGDVAMPEDVALIPHEDVAGMGEEQVEETREEEEQMQAEEDPEAEEFESIKDLSHSQEDENEPPEVSEARNEVEDRLRDEQFDSSSSSNVEEDDSESMSDFEVIPLPECFDTTRPLSGSEKGDKSNPASLTQAESQTDEAGQRSRDATTQSASMEDKEQVEDLIMEDSEPQQTATTSQNKATGRDPSSDTEEMETKDVETPRPAMPEVAFEEPGSLSSAPTSVNISEAVAVPKPVPQSVLAMDEPCEVQDYSQGYQMPQQQLSSPETAWVPEPIVLPPGVLASNEPWLPPQASQPASVASRPGDAEELSSVPENMPPVPQPRSSLQGHGTDEAPEPLTSGMIASPQPNQMEFVENGDEEEEEEQQQNEEPVEDDDNPQILYPPLLDTDTNDEFTLAPQAPEAPSLPQEAVHFYNPSPMEVLIEMGFMDVELNGTILSQCDGDVNRAVQSLLHRAQSTAAPPHSNARPHQRRSDGSFIA